MAEAFPDPYAFHQHHRGRLRLALPSTMHAVLAFALPLMVAASLLLYLALRPSPPAVVFYQNIAAASRWDEASQLVVHPRPGDAVPPVLVRNGTLFVKVQVIRPSGLLDAVERPRWTRERLRELPVPPPLVERALDASPWLPEGGRGHAA